MGNRLAIIDMGRKLGWGVPLLGWGAGSPCNTMWPGARSTFIPSGILIHPAVWSQQTWAEIWGSCASWPLRLFRIQHNVARAKAYHRTKWHLNQFSSLTTTNMGRKFGGSAPFWRGELGFHLTQCRLCRGLPFYQVAS